MKKPSLKFGFQLSLRLWPLLLALWITPMIFFGPFRIFLSIVTRRAFGNIPEAFVPPHGDLPLLFFQALTPLLPAIAVALGAGLLLTWAWTILWHAGLCRWLVWRKADTPRLLPILGHGILRWTAYFRLSVVSFLSFALLVGGTAALSAHLIRNAMDEMQENRGVIFLLTAMLLIALFKILLWAGTMRGAWELALPHRRSAFMAFFRGLRGALTQPVATLLPTAVFGVVIAALCCLPLLLGLYHPGLRSGWQAVLLFAASGLAASFLQLWIFASMAPIVGVFSMPAAADPEDHRRDEEA